MGFPRQEYWSGLSFLPNTGIKLETLVLVGRFFITSATWEAPVEYAPQVILLCLCGWEPGPPVVLLGQGVQRLVFGMPVILQTTRPRPKFIGAVLEHWAQIHSESECSKLPAWLGPWDLLLLCPARSRQTGSSGDDPQVLH